MAKKKKKPEEVSLDSATKKTIETKSTLQGLLKGVTEGEGYFKVQKAEQEEVAAPQLSYEQAKEIADMYITQTDILKASKGKKGKKRAAYVPKEKRKPTQYSSFQEKIEQKRADVLAEAQAEAQAELKKDSEITGNIYDTLGSFFEELTESYSERYRRWENSISNLLSILRKMRKFTKKNTEDLESSISNLFETTQHGLNEFKVKRDEIEKVAGVNIQNMSVEFRRVLGLLEMQIKEYQLKRLADDLIHIKRIYS
jgi:hypothetical protein